VHRQRGQSNREPTDVAFVLPVRDAVDDRADVGGRSTHVEGQGVRETGERREPRCADDTSRGSREKRVGRMRRCLVQRGQPARRAHDERWRKRGPGTGVRERAEVAREHRSEIGVDGRRRSALVLAELRCHLV
jgi:hypothetical protein